MKTNFYTGVGSRETPKDVGELMEQVAYKLATDGYVLRSGGAAGADNYFYQGAKRAFEEGYVKPCIYLSWNGMNELYHDEEKGLYVANRFVATYPDAQAIAKDVRGSFDGLGRGGIAHHTRNVFQVIGHDLNTPSRFLICWAVPSGTAGRVKGGTNTAVKLALRQGIEVINLYETRAVDRVLAYLAGV